MKQAGIYFRRARLWTLLLGLLAAYGTQAQQVTKMEYFVDNDPGFGMGTDVPVTAAADLTKSFAVNINRLSNGFHNLYVRAYVAPYQATATPEPVPAGVAPKTFDQSKGGWTLTHVRPFYKDEMSMVNALPANIVKGEYFVDTDPGFGMGTNIPVTAGTNLTSVPFAVNISSLSSGFHNLYVRFQNAAGQWSLTNVRPFYKEDLSLVNTPLPNIVKGEYFIDNDPGFGMGTSISFSQSSNLTNVTFAATLTSLEPGFHNLYVRFQDQKGNWGQTNMRSFYKEQVLVTDPLPDITKVEYFVDTDPGFGAGTNVPVTPGTNLTNVAFTLDMSNISIGNHKLYVRAQDAAGRWSIVQIRDFKVETPTTPIITMGTVSGSPFCAGGSVSVPFTLNQTFGSNNVFTAQLSDANGNFASPVAIGTLNGGTAGTITATIPAGAPVGTGYRIRVISSSPVATSAVSNANLTVTTVPGNPGGITGLTAVCAGGSQSYSVAAVANVTYTWKVGNTEVGTGNSVSVLWSTTGSFALTATPSNSCGAGSASAMQVNVTSGVPAQATISASGTLLTSSSPSGNQWFRNGGAINGATGRSYNVTQGGSYTVKVTNPCGTGPESDQITFSDNLLLPQSISFATLPDKTFGNAPFTISATASSGLPVSFSVISGPATLSGNAVTITGGGQVTIRATQSGNSTYAAATLVDRTFTVNRMDQTIAFDPLATKTFGDAAFIVSATASSGLAVNFSILSGPATISGNTVSITGAGAVTVRATQAGNSNYNAATPADQSFTVNKAGQLITVENIPGKITTDPPFGVIANASSGLPVSLSILSGPATISGNTITLTGAAGTVTVRAAQSGSGNYNAAPNVDQSFVVSKAKQEITFGTLPDKVMNDGPFTVSATATSGLAVNFSILSGPATISGTLIRLTGQTGTVVVRASQTGNNTYNAATSVERSFSVNSAPKLSQTITFATLPDKTYGDAPFTLSASASPNLPVNFSISSVPSGIATLSGSQVTILGAGTVTVTAMQAGNDTYNAAADVSRSFTVNKKLLTVTVQNKSRIYGAANPELTFTYSGFVGSEGASVIDTPPTVATTATVNSNVGRYPVTLSGGSDNNYSFSFVSGTLTVTKAPAQVVLSDLNQTYDGMMKPVTVSTTPSGLKVDVTYNGSILVPANASSYAVVATVNETNYSGSATGTLAIAQADQTITFNSLSDKVVGDAAFSPSAKASSNLPVSFSILSGPATISGNTVTLTGKTGTVVVRASQAGNNNYNAALPADRSFSVNSQSGLSQTIAFNNLPARIFGDAPFAVSAISSSNLPVSFSLSSVPSGIATLSGGQVTILGAGEVTITATQAGNGTYNSAADVSRSFTINKKQLTVTAQNKTRIYGQANPGLTFSYSGFVNSENASVIDVPPSVATTATVSSNVGAYPISLSGGSDNNYSFSYVGGTLTVEKATPVITWNAPAAITPGTALSGAQLNATANVPGSFLYNPAAGTVPAPGQHTLTASFTPGDAVNYNSAEKTVAITVTDASPVACAGTGSILREYWLNLSANGRLTALPLGTTPDGSSYPASFAAPVNFADRYGTRMRGYVCVPVSGDYVFYIASNDQGELYLSTDEKPENKSRIAFVNGWTAPNQYDKFKSQQSEMISLVAGKRYYIEALHSEGGGSDNLSVGWRLPDGTLERPIPGSRLIPFVPQTAVAPQVVISNPVAGSVYAQGVAINLQAQAKTLYGKVTKVEFFAGGSKLGEDLNEPFSFQWTPSSAGQHVITAKVTNDRSLSATSAPVTITVTDASPVACTGTGSLLREYWLNLPSGGGIASVPVNTQPGGTSQINTFSVPANFADNYGTRVRGYVCPPVSGDYIFYLSSDDRGELYLSTDEKPENKRRIAFVNGWTRPGQYDKYASQQSLIINLVAGQKYYTEALHRELGGNDHLSVGWLMADGTGQFPVAGAHLIPFVPVSSASPVARRAAGREPEMVPYLVSCFPNPFAGSFVLRVEGKPEGKLPAKLYDIFGRCVLTIEDVQPEQTVTLGPEIKTGVYTLMTGTGNAARYYKLVKAQ